MTWAPSQNLAGLGGGRVIFGYFSGQATNERGAIFIFITDTIMIGGSTRPGLPGLPREKYD